jgi:hypothetical protein
VHFGARYRLEPARLKAVDFNSHKIACTGRSICKAYKYWITAKDGIYADINFGMQIRGASILSGNAGNPLRAWQSGVFLIANFAGGVNTIFAPAFNTAQRYLNDRRLN